MLPSRAIRYPRSLRCSTCGYGIARATSPGPCPMCRTDDWEGPGQPNLVWEFRGETELPRDDLSEGEVRPGSYAGRW